ncbi:MAG: MMPL family transporter [Dehalococcoidia bacterium]
MSLNAIVGFCAKRPFLVIAIWVAVLLSSFYLSATYIEDALSGGQGSTIDQESVLARKLKDEKLALPNAVMDGQDSASEQQMQGSGEDSGSDNLLIVSSSKYIFPSEEYIAALNGYFESVQQEINANGINQSIGTFTDYYATPSEDGTTLMIAAPFVDASLVGPLAHLNEELSNDDFGFYFVGFASINHTFQELAEKDLVTGETIGISVAIIILALVFGSVVSAIIPIILALVAISISLGIISVMGQFVDLNDFVPNIVSMMGLAVGIDYCLFILSRYREERATGLEKIEAIVRTGSSAGRAVMFSGLTVVLALLGMFIIPEKTFQAFGVGATVVVFVAVFAGVTLLPALIGLMGDKVNLVYVHRKFTLVAFAIGFLAIAFTLGVGPNLLIASGVVMGILIILSVAQNFGIASNLLTPKNQSQSGEGGFWNAITLQVMRRPVISMVFAAGFLMFLGYFYFDLEKGQTGISALPDDQAVKIGFTLLDEKFGFGSNETANISIDADIQSESIKNAISKLNESLDADEGFLAPDISLYSSVNFAELSSRIPGDPQDMTALNSISRLRNDLIPNAFSGIPTSDYTVYVGGTTADTVDAVEMTDDYFPIVLGLVLTLSFLLLLFAFRSITISIASIVMNLLSVAASYGLLVLVFQYGFLIDVFGFVQVDQLEFWLPLFMFSILFGLSMDYHVFMLSRIKENFDETGSASDSVAFGLRRTASIITGAALIMVAVFGGFALGDLSIFQPMGFGLGAAVLIDATIVRSILVPSVMKLLGTKAWYLPSWLNWLPNISIEGEPTKTESN